MRYNKLVDPNKTPQTEPIPGSNQEMNNAGGYGWRVDDWKQLDRFLILGTEGGTYYVKERPLTLENAAAVVRCIQADGVRVVRRTVEISEAGRAPKNDPAIFVLALCAAQGNATTQAAAFEALPQVARISTHLFAFVETVQTFRGWGRALREAVGRWYNDKAPQQLAYQVVKYRQRNGWTHRDVLRLAHPRPMSELHKAIFYWIVKGWPGIGPEPHPDEVLRQIWAFEAAQRAETVPQITGLIREYKLTHEMVPNQFLKAPEVWEALLPQMPMTALIRNLGTMSRVGLLVPGHMEIVTDVSRRISNEELLRKARVHPLQVLAALNTYSQGHGVRGSGEWEVTPQVVDALDAGFYAAFGNVTPTGKSIMLALDVSGSMTWGTIAGAGGITPRVGSAAMALITAAVEPNYKVMGFSNKLVPLTISPRQRLDDVCKYIDGIPMGGTDCALPMIWALEKKAKVDLFVVYTDSETWYGKIHPTQALQQYRKEVNPAARLIVVGMVANQFTIADPQDAGMLDIVGFDTAAPEIISQFARGEV